MRRACQADTVASLTDFRGEREAEGTAWPSMLSLPEEVWRAMVANSRRIVWPGSKPERPKQVIINANGEEEEVSGDPNGGKAQTKSAILNAAIRYHAAALVCLHHGKQQRLGWCLIVYARFCSDNVRIDCMARVLEQLRQRCPPSAAIEDGSSLL